MDKLTNNCRSCLKNVDPFSHYTFSLYEDISPKQYLYCTSIEVKRDDQLPKAICGDCYNLINKFIEFKTRCIVSENKLLRLSEHSLHDEPCSDLEVKNEIRGDDTWRESSRNDNRTEIDTIIKIEIEDTKEDEAEEVLSDINNDLTCTDAPDTDLEDIEDHIEATRVSKTELRKSTVRNSQPKEFQCEQCNRKFSFKKRLEGHMLMHEGKIAPTECKECNKTFTTWIGLRRHIKACHSPLSFKDVTCQICSKVCKTSDTLRAHLRTHKERRERVCDECGKTFKSDVTFKIHLQTHTQSERVPCVHCGKKYMNKRVLYIHIHRQHSDLQLICDLCGFVCTHKGNLIRHMKIHAARHKSYKCDLCQSSFYTQSSLDRHKRIHSGEKPFSCSQCPKSYVTKYRLVTHEKVHTGERPYKCSLCEMTFALRSSYTRHVRRHNKISKT